jgi:membrane-associated phospholipid phosphatase
MELSLTPPGRVHPLLTLAAAGLLFLCATTARAQPPGPIYELRLGVDLPLTAASAVLGAGWLLRSELAAPSCTPQCERAGLPGFDRGAAGRYDARARLVSDLGVGAVVLGSSSVLLLDGGLVDFAVGAEAVLATSAIAVLTMYAVRRPRPFSYGSEAPLSAREDGNAALAFPSGHTANAFAATLATFHMLHARHPGSPWPWLALGTGLALSSGVGLSRVLAGDHFPSDVVAGAALGTAIGWLVPELHRVAPSVTLAPSGSVGLALSGSLE